MSKQPAKQPPTLATRIVARRTWLPRLAASAAPGLLQRSNMASIQNYPVLSVQRRWQPATAGRSGQMRALRLLGHQRFAHERVGQYAVAPAKLRMRRSEGADDISDLALAKKAAAGPAFNDEDVVETVEPSSAEPSISMAELRHILATREQAAQPGAPSHPSPPRQRAEPPSRPPRIERVASRQPAPSRMRSFSRIEELPPRQQASSEPNIQRQPLPPPSLGDEGSAPEPRPASPGAAEVVALSVEPPQPRLEATPSGPIEAGTPQPVAETGRPDVEPPTQQQRLPVFPAQRNEAAADPAPTRSSPANNSETRLNPSGEPAKPAGQLMLDDPSIKTSYELNPGPASTAPKPAAEASPQPRSGPPARSAAGVGGAKMIVEPKPAAAAPDPRLAPKVDPPQQRNLPVVDHLPVERSEPAGEPLSLLEDEPVEMVERASEPDRAADETLDLKPARLEQDPEMRPSPPPAGSKPSQAVQPKKESTKVEGQAVTLHPSSPIKPVKTPTTAKIQRRHETGGETLAAPVTADLAFERPAQRVRKALPPSAPDTRRPKAQLQPSGRPSATTKGDIQPGPGSVAPPPLRAKLPERAEAPGRDAGLPAQLKPLPEASPRPAPPFVQRQAAQNSVEGKTEPPAISQGPLEQPPRETNVVARQVAPVESDTPAGPNDQTENPPNLDQLARQIYPLIKRRLLIERQQVSRW